MPTIQLPFVPTALSLHLIGCFGGDGKTYIGKKHGNRADIQKLLHIKQIKKWFTENIDGYLEGKLDNPQRGILFDARAVRLGQELAEILQDFDETVGQITEEIDAGLALVTGKINELNSLRNELLTLSEGSISKADQLMLQRYGEYSGELGAQAERLNAVKNCIGAF
ncbi:MAG TPA: hypothetical protein VE732_07630 [Nitrososphaera sp.]|nr:hypothetical protein [Nitrososphaera sp.]